MGTRVQTILRHKNNTKIDILYSNTTSFDTLEIVSEATDIYKTLDEVKSHLINFKKFSKTAKRPEGFIEDNSLLSDFEYIILVDDLRDSVFSVNRIRFFDYDFSKKELYKDFTESLILDSLNNANNIVKVATTNNGCLYKLNAKNKIFFIEIDDKNCKEETLEFLLELYLSSTLEPLVLVS